MAKKFTQDEFDLATRAGGHHRGVKTASSRWLGLLSYVATVAVISGAGIVALNIFSQAAEEDPIDINPTTTVQVTEKFNGDGLGVTVIDTTKADSKAAQVAQTLLDKGWNVYGAANSGYGAGIVSLKQTTVFYNSELSKAAATSVLEDLGNYQLAQSSAFTDPITVVLANDYK